LKDESSELLYAITDKDLEKSSNNSQFSTLNSQLQSFALQRDIGGTTLSRYTKLMLGHSPKTITKEK